MRGAGAKGAFVPSTFTVLLVVEKSHSDGACPISRIPRSCFFHYTILTACDKEGLPFPRQTLGKNSLDMVRAVFYTLFWEAFDGYAIKSLVGLCHC